MQFRVYYVILLVADLVFGSIYIIDPIIVRYLVDLVLIGVCLKERATYPKNVYIFIYTLFITIFMCTSFLEGYEVDFIKLFIGYYLSTYLWIWATYILIKKYNRIETMIYSLFAICLVNAFITIGQHYMQQIAFTIPELIGVNVGKVDSMFEKSDTVITQFALAGIFGAFQNGYYSAVGAVLSLVLWGRKKNYFYLLFLPICLFGLFCVQERAALVAGLFFSLVLLYKTLIDSKSQLLKVGVIVFSVIALFYLISVGLDYSSYIEGTRYESFDWDTRTDLYKWSVDYIMDHPLSANLFDFYNTYQHYPHNFIYNSFIYGTFSGGLMIIGCMIAIWIKAAKTILHPISKNNFFIIILAFALFAYSMAGFTHNASIVTGDTLFWLLASPFVFSDVKKVGRISRN